MTYVELQSQISIRKRKPKMFSVTSCYQVQTVDDCCMHRLPPCNSSDSSVCLTTILDALPALTKTFNICVFLDAV